MFAKEWLKKIMNDAEITKPCSARVIVSAAQAGGIKRERTENGEKGTRYGIRLHRWCAIPAFTGG